MFTNCKPSFFLYYIYMSSAIREHIFDINRACVDIRLMSASTILMTDDAPLNASSCSADSTKLCCINITEYLKSGYLRDVSFCSFNDDFEVSYVILLLTRRGILCWMHVLSSNTDSIFLCWVAI